MMRSGALRRRSGERLAAAEAAPAHGQIPGGVPRRRRLARAHRPERDQPRGRILKDEAIDEIAAQAPTDADALEPAALGAEGLRRLALRTRAGRGDHARRWRIRRPTRRRSSARPRPPRPAAGAVVELLKVLLKARAEDAGVASKLIATVADLEKIAGDDRADTAGAARLAARGVRRGRAEAEARRAGAGAGRRAGARGAGAPRGAGDGLASP